MTSEHTAWFYCSGGSQKGPFPSIVLCRLLEKGIGVSAQSVVWKEGMVGWEPMEKISPFKEIIEFRQIQWYYISMDGEQRGPILSKLLLHKLKEGELDGLTLVYCGNMTEWKKVAEVPSLKIEMAKIAADEESARLAFAKPSIEDQQKQVFVDDHSSNFVASTSCLFAENRQNVISGERKTFVADNGQLYMWDEQEDSWVEADKETTEMFNIEQSDDNISTNAGNKRKATDDHDDIVEDDVDGDDNKGNNSTGVSEETCNKKQQPKKKKKVRRKRGPIHGFM